MPQNSSCLLALDYYAGKPEYLKYFAALQQFFVMTLIPHANSLAVIAILLNLSNPQNYHVLGRDRLDVCRRHDERGRGHGTQWHSAWRRRHLCSLRRVALRDFDVPHGHTDAPQSDSRQRKSRA
jgi:hypothetical protein